MKTTPVPLVMLVSQRHQADCAIAATAMYLGVSYEDCLLAFGDVGILRGGAWFTQIIRAAAKFGVELRKRPSFDPEQSDGLLKVKHRKGPQHVVLIREGFIFDTDCSVWAPGDYIQARGGKFGMLLERVN